MRILSFCPRYLPLLAGGEVAAHGIHRELARLGHRVHVITETESADGRGRRMLDGIEILHAPMPPPYARCVEESQPDLLFTQFEQAAPTVRFAVEAGLPVAVMCHGPYGYDNLAKEDLVHAVDLFVFNSTFLSGLAKRTVHHVVVSPPIDLARVRAPANATPLYAAAHFNLYTIKGPEVFYALASRFPDREFLGVRGSYGLQDERSLPNVDLCDPVQRVGKLYGAARVLLMPSVRESFGLVALEAQSNGIPVIASDLPSLRDSLGNGALFVDRDDLDGWSDALRALDDAGLYDVMARRARENVERFDITRDVSKLERALAAMLARPKPQAARR